MSSNNVFAQLFILHQTYNNNNKNTQVFVSSIFAFLWRFLSQVKLLLHDFVCFLLFIYMLCIAPSQKPSEVLRLGSMRPSKGSLRWWALQENYWLMMALTSSSGSVHWWDRNLVTLPGSDGNRKWAQGKKVTGRCPEGLSCHCLLSLWFFLFLCFLAAIKSAPGLCQALLPWRFCSAVGLRQWSWLTMSWNLCNREVGKYFLLKFFFQIFGHSDKKLTNTDG